MRVGSWPCEAARGRRGTAVDAAPGLFHHGYRESDPRAEACPTAFSPDAAPVRLDQPLANRKAQAGSLNPAVPAVDPGVLAEQPSQLVRRQAPAFVGHRHCDVRPRRALQTPGWATTRARAGTHWRRDCSEPARCAAGRPVPGAGPAGDRCELRAGRRHSETSCEPGRRAWRPQSAQARPTAYRSLCGPYPAGR